MTDSPSSTPPITASAPATPVCALYPTADVVRLLRAGPLTQIPTSSGCLWFASDHDVNVALAVNVYATAAEATTTFQSEQQFDPTAHPFTFGDRAYLAVLSPRHARAMVLTGSAITLAEINGPAQPTDVSTAALTIVKAASTRVSQGLRP